MLVKQDRECSHCHTLFPCIEGKIFANHVRWCPANITNGDKGRNAIRQAHLRNAIKRQDEFEVICHHCSSSFVVIEKKNRFPTKKRYFCSKKCGYRKFQNEDTKRKIGDALRKNDYNRICDYCSKSFIASNKAQKTCSRSCAGHNRIKNKLSFRAYWLKCQFKFSLNDYPDEFDFSLIKRYGWYKAANRGNNLN